jgi:hypothetical protein
LLERNTLARVRTLIKNAFSNNVRIHNRDRDDDLLQSPRKFWRGVTWSGITMVAVPAGKVFLI